MVDFGMCFSQAKYVNAVADAKVSEVESSQPIGRRKESLKRTEPFILSPLRGPCY